MAKITDLENYRAHGRAYRDEAARLAEEQRLSRLDAMRKSGAFPADDKIFREPR